MRVLFISGAPWGATTGNQRYQALAENLRKVAPEIDVKFYSWVDGATPPPYRWTNEPLNVIIIGYPELGRHFLKAFGEHPLAPIIYDLCDYWKGNELIEGADLREADDYIVQKCQVLVAVNWQIACQYVQYGKPIYVIGNGIREEALTPPTSIITDDKVHVYYWGSHFSGQTWTDISALNELPRRFPECLFHYFLASDLSPDTLFPEIPSNLEVKVHPLGMEFIQIKSVLRYPAIGIVPFNPLNTAAFYADPIKVYEYWALGMYVVATNVWSCLGERPNILYRQGIVLDELCKGIEELLRRPKLEPQFPSPEERQMLSWENRARQYLEILRKFPVP